MVGGLPAIYCLHIIHTYRFLHFFCGNVSTRRTDELSLRDDTLIDLSGKICKICSYYTVGSVRSA